MSNFSEESNSTPRKRPIGTYSTLAPFTLILFISGEHFLLEKIIANVVSMFDKFSLISSTREEKFGPLEKKVVSSANKMHDRSLETEGKSFT